MSLHLDARQRAMLQEMGVTVWVAPEATPATATATTAPAARERGVTAPAAAPTVATSRTATRPTPAPTRAQPPTPRMAAPAPHSGVQTAHNAQSPATAQPAQHQPAWKLHAVQSLYPAADPAQVPAELGGAWLIVAENSTPADPLGSDAGRLLDNMLRAMQLHRHPRVYLAALQRSSPQWPASDDIPTTLADTVATVQPAMVLLLGHVAARVALGRTEPLGHLRTEPHQLAGCPAVVTYDPAFLLRSQEAKPAAWVDLCRALAIVRIASSAT